jgi:hypothetical protein
MMPPVEKEASHSGHAPVGCGKGWCPSWTVAKASSGNSVQDFEANFRTLSEDKPLLLARKDTLFLELIG